MNTETGWTKQDRDDLARTIAESNITDGLLENADIDTLVDLFEAWTERRGLPASPADAEQLAELRRACEAAFQMLNDINRDLQLEPKPRRDALAIAESANDGSYYVHAFLRVEQLEATVTQLFAVLNPKPEKETQEK